MWNLLLETKSNCFSGQASSNHAPVVVKEQERQRQAGLEPQLDEDEALLQRLSNTGSEEGTGRTTHEELSSPDNKFKQILPQHKALLGTQL
eukprot:1737497-Amphidinium_carterae.1